jgi:hypothetical protein
MGAFSNPPRHLPPHLRPFFFFFSRCWYLVSKKQIHPGRLNQDRVEFADGEDDDNDDDDDDGARDVEGTTCTWFPRVARR